MMKKFLFFNLFILCHLFFSTFFLYFHLQFQIAARRERIEKSDGILYSSICNFVAEREREEKDPLDNHLFPYIINFYQTRMWNFHLFIAILIILHKLLK